MIRSFSPLLVAAVVTTAGVSVHTSPAQACGGTFCDNGPNAMPVDQTGENILFIRDGNFVETHVQIQYEGDPERFAWIVPVAGVPEVSVGSEQFIQNIMAASVPAYGFTIQRDSCDLEMANSINFGGNGTGGTGSGAGGAGGDGPSGPVVYTATVGAFEVTALSSDDPDEVINWLTENDYEVVGDTPAIIADYVTKNFVFAAIKMTPGAGSDEIHPLVFRYEGEEPCVPLVLTSVAAVENMAVRTYFLGDERWVPTNYRHVEIDPLRVDWSTRGANYVAVVTEAVDVDHADGRAFVTEYAGNSNTVTRDRRYEQYDSSRF